MFSSLRQNSTLYILDKAGVPKLKIGKVTGTTTPVPKYNVPTNGLGGFETVLDIFAEAEGTPYEFKKVPSQVSIYSDNNVVISESREAMSAEIEAIKTLSSKVIAEDNIKFHNDVVESCDIIQATLNPNIAREKENENKINALEQKLSNIETILSKMNERFEGVTN